jgi:ribokinase
MIPSVDLFVIGTTSFDTLHLADKTTHQTVGGAGLYTALAAHRIGVEAGLFGPRPVPMPESLQPIADRLTWLGPEITPTEIAHLEIAHHGSGKAKLINASWGAEPDFMPHNIPQTVINTPIVHIAALSSAQRQLDFLIALLQDKPEDTLISVGTYGKLVHEDLERVKQLFDLADIFFMNESEATGFFGSVEQAISQPEGILFVTLGESGVLVIIDDEKTLIPAVSTHEVDPTGAGDTFCGATLAGLLQGMSPIDAAQQAVILASQTVSAIGPAALIHD